jgi:hypothetical protein
MNQHQEKRIQKLTDLSGCYNKEKLILRNDSFAYTILTDSRFNLVFPKDEFQWAREDEEYNWKLNYLRINLTEESEDETLEEVYKNYENKIFSKPKDRISLMVGETYHKHNFTGNYQALWDNRRGLIDVIKRSIQFERVQISDSENKILFIAKDSSGINQKLIGKEFYYFKRNKGFFILLLYPEKFEKLGNEIANGMKILAK